MMSAEKDNGRAVTTTNYSYIESSVNNLHEALIIAEVTSYPHELIVRCGILLFEVMYKYLLQGNDFSRLRCCIDQGGQTIKAELASIHEQLMLAEQMLKECQDYNEKFKGDADNDERAEA